MSLLTVRVFSREQDAVDAKNQLEVAGFTVSGPTEHAPVAWDATLAEGSADGVSSGWVVIARK